MLGDQSASSETSRINMIIVGLPFGIQEEIDREEVNTIEKLFTEFRKLDNAFKKIKKEVTVNHNNANQTSQNTTKKTESST